VKSDQGNLIERSQERLAIDFLSGSLERQKNARHLPPVVIPLCGLKPAENDPYPQDH
jgi:hypothetical protein